MSRQLELFHSRLWLEGLRLWSLKKTPGFKYRLFFWGHGGDEYGNCSLYFMCPLFGITWFYPTGHFQRDVLLPENNEWVDRAYMGEEYWKREWKK